MTLRRCPFDFSLLATQLFERHTPQGKTSSTAKFCSTSAFIPPLTAASLKSLCVGEDVEPSRGDADSDCESVLSTQTAQMFIDDDINLAKLDKLPSTEGRYVITDHDGKPAAIRLSQGDIRHMKQLRARDRYLKHRLNLSWDSDNIDDHIKLLCFYGVSPNTFSGYSSHWDQLLKAGFPLTLSGLQSFLAKRRKKYSNASIVHWTSAIRLYEATMGDSAENRHKYFSAGYQRDNPNGITKKRGAITCDLLQELINHPSVKNTIYHNGYQLQYAVGLRSDQMSSVHADHFRPVRDTKTKTILNYVYIVPRHKFKSSHKKTAIEHHICDLNYLELITSMIASARNSSDGYLIPNWDGSTARDLISAAAPHLGWDVSLQWVNHSIRHGASLDAADSSPDQSQAGRLNAAQNRTAQGSLLVVSHYAESQEMRAAAAQAIKLFPHGLNRVSIDGITLVRSKQSVRACKTSLPATIGGKRRSSVPLAQVLQTLNEDARKSLGTSFDKCAKLIRAAALKASKKATSIVGKKKQLKKKYTKKSNLKKKSIR